MAGRERRYVLDTNIFIHAARDEQFNQALARFHAAFAPFELLSAVVVQELMAGVRGSAARTLERTILDPFERRGRVIVPSYQAWKEAAGVLASLTSSGVCWTNVSRSFVNDVLLAMSCREVGVVLVTENTRDFERIADVRPFDFVAPWPVPTS
jgi:predicted nucleic acid-binding protein